MLTDRPENFSQMHFNEKQKRISIKKEVNNVLCLTLKSLYLPVAEIPGVGILTKLVLKKRILIKKNLKGIFNQNFGLNFLIFIGILISKRISIKLFVEFVQ